MAGEKNIPEKARRLMVKQPVLMVRCPACETMNHRFYQAKSHMPPEGITRTLTCSKCKKDFGTVIQRNDETIDSMIRQAS